MLGRVLLLGKHACGDIIKCAYHTPIHHESLPENLLLAAAQLLAKCTYCGRSKKVAEKWLMARHARE